jgi:hypothetical protein
VVDQTLGTDAVSCRTGALRGPRPLRGVCTALRGAPVGRVEEFCADHREDHPKGYTRHEVTALRGGGPSGRTLSSHIKAAKLYREVLCEAGRAETRSGTLPFGQPR